MIAAFVTFDTDGLDEARVRSIAAEARATFEGMASLRTKLFTLDDGNRARNVYVWESDHAARQFFTAELLEHVTDIYGARAHVEFAEIVELVDNTAGPGTPSTPAG